MTHAPAYMSLQTYPGNSAAPTLSRADWTSISASLHIISVFNDHFEVVGSTRIKELRREAILSGSSKPWKLPMSFSQGHHFVAMSEDLEEELLDTQVTFREVIPRVQSATRAQNAYAGFMKDWVRLNRAVERYRAYLRERNYQNVRLVTSIRSGQIQATKQQGMFHATFLLDHAPTLDQLLRLKAEELELDLVWQIHLRLVPPPEGWPISWFERMLVRRKTASRRKCECKSPQICDSCSPFKRTLASGYYRESKGGCDPL